MAKAFCVIALSLLWGAAAWALDGTLVGTTWGGGWYAPGDLVVVDCKTAVPRTIVRGGCYGASFSPNGRRVAYFKDGKSIRICDLDGGNDKMVVANAGYSEVTGSAANWCANDWIYWGAGKNVYRVKTDGSRKQTVHTAGFELMICSISQDGRRGACTTYRWHVEAFTIGGASRNLGGGCQGTISPNGAYVSHNLDHRQARIHNFADGSVAASIRGAGQDFNNHRFSSLSNDYVCYTDKNNGAYVCHWRSDTSYAIAKGIKAWDYNPKVVGNTPTVRIDSFAASPSTVTAGASTSLSWETTNATKVSLDQGIGTVGTSASKTVTPANTTTYTLTAEGASGPVTRKVTVTLTAPNAVQIDSFAASADVLTEGESTTLSWQTTNATKVTIDQGVGALSDAGSRKVTPTITVTYTLTAEGTGGPVQKQVNVTVKPGTPPSQPSITIVSPTGGEFWAAGSTQIIRWTSVGLLDATLSYTTDGGKTWKLILSSIDDASESWGQYPWKVPDEASALCQVYISGYMGEAPTTSKIFEITSGAPDVTAPSLAMTHLGVAGTVDDASGASVLIGGIDFPVAEGAFAAVARADGSGSALAIQATDPSGNTHDRRLNLLK